jgi:hypothetical protein
LEQYELREGVVFPVPECRRNAHWGFILGYEVAFLPLR